MIQIRNLLLPTDFSDASLEANRYAVELSRRFGARLHLFHAIQDPVAYLPFLDSEPLPSREEFESYAQTRLENWILPEDQEGLELVYRWSHGSPFVEIIRYAKGAEIDLIVLGTHGRGFTAHLLLGSVTEKVVRKAPCPVLTVRPSGHQFVHPAAEEVEG